MKPTILLINFQDQQKLRKLKMALLPFKLRIKTIEPQDYSQPIGYLAGVKEISQVQIPSALIPQEQMEKEMLILAGITGNLFDQVLYTLRKAGTPVDYKAVLTEHNQNWNCMQLYKELEKELREYLDVPQISLMVNGHMALEMAIQEIVGGFGYEGCSCS